MKKIILNLLTGLVLVMSAFQIPFFYYYTFGIAAFFQFVIYQVLGLSITIFLIVDIFLDSFNDNLISTTFQKYGVLFTLILGFISLLLLPVLSPNKLEKWDWDYRLKERNKIVQDIKNGKKFKRDYGSFVLDEFYFPPITNSGNSISIDRYNDSIVTVEFYINKGFLDHYSAFVYTNDEIKIKELEERAKFEKTKENNKILGNNWFRVSY